MNNCPLPIKKAPVLPLKKMVVFPNSIVPIYVARDMSRRIVEYSKDMDVHIIFAAQKNALQENPNTEDLYKVGSLCKIIQFSTFADGTLQVMVEAIQRVKITNYSQTDPFFEAEFEFLDDEADDGVENEALFRTLVKSFEIYIRNVHVQYVDLMNTINSLNDVSKASDLMVGYLSVKVEEKQKILEQTSVKAKLKKLISLIELELQIINLEKSIKQQVEKNQKQYFLQEQAKIIQQELNNGEEDPIDVLDKKIKKSKMSKEAKEKAKAELSKLRYMNNLSGEASMVKSYIECLLDLPWSKPAALMGDFKKSKDILDSAHYGLEDIKERIYELIAVHMRVPKSKGNILCLFGPPGVGKTSIVKSIAKAMGRPFIRISLGGVNDEAEIRGHRRTYIGAMPGKIINAMKKAKVSNPLILLDEIGKVGHSFKGDPAAALLEVLDPEQNDSFQDHYLEVGYDLSNVLFIATTNTLDLPAPLMDRLDIMKISGYTEFDKVNIASKYLIPKQKELHLLDKELIMTDDAIKQIIRHYTREAGVRNLERNISKIARKTVKFIQSHDIPSELLQQNSKDVVEITDKNVSDMLGIPKYSSDPAELQDRIGVCTGLAWTEAGGDILYIESAIFPGTGKVTGTGHLGDVMKESVQAAMTFIKSKYEQYGLDKETFTKNDVHVHVPEGAIPKDGPSAGVAICCAIISSLLKKQVKGNLAMTGEISLRGLVLPIGGVKEKVLAAHRSGITNVILPKKNEKDLEDVPNYVKDKMNIQLFDNVDDVIKMTLIDEK